MANVKGAVGKIVGGWQINGVMSYQSGEPIGVGVNNTLPLFNEESPGYGVWSKSGPFQRQFRSR